MFYVEGFKINQTKKARKLRKGTIIESFKPQLKGTAIKELNKFNVLTFRQNQIEGIRGVSNSQRGSVGPKRKQEKSSKQNLKGKIENLIVMIDRVGNQHGKHFVI